MDINEIIKLFKNKKFKIKDISCEYGLAYSTENESVIIGIFDHDYPNTNYRGKILAEHKNNFDKWSKSFYIANFPANKDEFKIILSDIKHISNSLNEASGAIFGHLIREF